VRGVGEACRHLRDNLEQIRDELLNGRNLSKKGSRKRQADYSTRTAEKALRWSLIESQYPTNLIFVFESASMKLF
jgi:hypothetical protein